MLFALEGATWFSFVVGLAIVTKLLLFPNAVFGGIQSRFWTHLCPKRVSKNDVLDTSTTDIMALIADIVVCSSDFDKHLTRSEDVFRF